MGMGKFQKRILIVENDENTREGLREFFEVHNYQVETEKNGHEAYQKLVRENYDALVVDNNLKQLSGLELVRRVRLENKDITIYFTSSNYCKEIERELQGIGIKFYSDKPVNPNLLHEKIATRQKTV